MSDRIKDSENWITSIIKQFITKSPENTLKNEKNEKAWGEPILGFSNGGDPLYQFYKDDIGQFYFKPSEAFARVFPNLPVRPGQLTVISWILPHTETTKSEYRKQEALPTERWARARIFGEEVNDKLRRHVIANSLMRDLKRWLRGCLHSSNLEDLRNISMHQLGQRGTLHMRLASEPSVYAMD